MQDSRQSRIASALAIMERLVAMCCTRPELLDMVVDMGSVLIGVSFNVHANDVRTIVGEKGKHLSLLKFLFNRLLDGTGMEGEIERVNSVQGVNTVFDNAGREIYPKVKIETLLRDLAVGCYPEQRVALEVKDSVDRTRINVLFDSEPQDKHDFARAIALLFLPIGKICSRRIVVDVRVVTSKDLIERTK